MPLQSWTPVVIAHAVLASGALVLGAGLLALPKGSLRHRLAGWAWVLLMTVVAGSSFAIRRDGFSWIHGLAVFTLMALVIGVAHARTHRRVAHRRTMTAIYLCALVLTGLFTLLPHRLIGQALWSRWP